MDMKKFKDIKVGDTCYVISDCYMNFENITPVKVTNINEFPGSNQRELEIDNEYFGFVRDSRTSGMDDEQDLTLFATKREAIQYLRERAKRNKLNSNWIEIVQVTKA